MVTDKQKREYDRFGPWVTEIEGEDDVPDLFVPYYTERDTIDYAFKIPRQVERRNASAGQNLYNYVVFLRRDRVEVLHYNHDDVDVDSAPYDEVDAVRVLSDLLYGELSLYLERRTVSFSYNTVSEEIVERAVTMIRARCTGGVNATVPDDEVDPERLTHLYRGLVMRERKHMELGLVAFQPAADVEKRNPTFWDRTLDILRRPRLRAMIVMVSPSELVIYRGEPQVARFRRGNYGYAKLIVPFHAITATDTLDNPTYTGVEDLTVRTVGHVFRVQTAKGFPFETVRRVVETATS